MKITASAQALTEANKIAKDNLPTCCRELIAWRASCILPDGFIRKMSDVMKAEFPQHHLELAKVMVETLAIESVANDAL